MIGLFNECFPPVMDGVSLTVSNLARSFYLQGKDVAVVTPEMPGLDESQLPYSLFQYRSFPVPGRHPYRYGFPSLDFTFQKQVAAQNFEILHAHCPFSSGDFALKTARRMGIPLVATFHSKYRDDFERVIPNKALVDYLVGKVVKFYESVDEVWVPQASVGETLREYGYKGTFEVVD
ncbi:glycosyltransferase family 4 protein, partial [Prevotella copri]